MFSRRHPAVPGPADPQRLAEAEAALEAGHRQYAEAVHLAAKAEHTSKWLIHIRRRNHIGPGVADALARGRR